MKNWVPISVSREEVTSDYPFSLLMHYGLCRLVLGFNMLLVIRHGMASGRRQLEEKAKIQTACIPVHRTLLTAQLDLRCLCPGETSGLWTPVQVTQQKHAHTDGTGTMGRAVGQLSLHHPLTALYSAAVGRLVPTEPRSPQARAPIHCLRQAGHNMQPWAVFIHFPTNHIRGTYLIVN